MNGNSALLLLWVILGIISLLMGRFIFRNMFYQREAKIIIIPERANRLLGYPRDPLSIFSQIGGIILIVLSLFSGLVHTKLDIQTFIWVTTLLYFSVPCWLIGKWKRKSQNPGTDTKTATQMESMAIGEENNHGKYPVIIVLICLGVFFIGLMIWSILDGFGSLSLSKIAMAFLEGILWGLLVSGFEYLWSRFKRKPRYKPSIIPIVVLVVIAIGLTRNDLIPYLSLVLAIYLFVLAASFAGYEKKTESKWVTISQLYDSSGTIRNLKDRK